MITEDYVSFETAKLLKKKGFDEFCSYYYGPFTDTDNEYKLEKFFSSIMNSGLIDDAYTAPTLQMAMKWLREKEIFVEVTHTLFSSPHKYQYSIFRTEPEFYTAGDKYESYEEACDAAIKYCLENLI